jgi:DNA polymerase III delta prime subunit
MSFLKIISSHSKRKQRPKENKKLEIVQKKSSFNLFGKRNAPEKKRIIKKRKIVIQEPEPEQIPIEPEPEHIPIESEPEQIPIESEPLPFYKKYISLVGRDSDVYQLKRFIKSRFANPRINKYHGKIAYILRGKPGCGKSLLVKKVAEELKCRVLCFGADYFSIGTNKNKTKSRYEKLTNVCAEFKRKQHNNISLKDQFEKIIIPNIFNKGFGSRKIIVFDGIDGFHPSVISKIIPILKSLCGNKTKKGVKPKQSNPIIIISDDKYVPLHSKLKNSTFKKHIELCTLYDLQKNDTMALLKKIYYHENRIFDKELCLQLVNQSNGDIRYMLNQLEFEFLSNDSKIDNRYYDNNILDGMSCAHYIRQGGEPIDVSNRTVNFLFENYLTNITNDGSLEQMCKTADNFASYNLMNSGCYSDSFLKPEFKYNTKKWLKQPYYPYKRKNVWNKSYQSKDHSSILDLVTLIRKNSKLDCIYLISTLKDMSGKDKKEPNKKEMGYNKHILCPLGKSPFFPYQFNNKKLNYECSISIVNHENIKLEHVQHLSSQLFNYKYS